MNARLSIIFKRTGKRKSDGSPYLVIKFLVPVGAGIKASGLDVVEQFVSPDLDRALEAVPGVYDVKTEPRSVNGRFEQVITGLKLVSPGLAV